MYRSSTNDDRYFPAVTIIFVSDNEQSVLLNKCHVVPEGHKFWGISDSDKPRFKGGRSEWANIFAASKYASPETIHASQHIIHGNVSFEQHHRSHTPPTSFFNSLVLQSDAITIPKLITANKTQHRARRQVSGRPRFAIRILLTAPGS